MNAWLTTHNSAEHVIRAAEPRHQAIDRAAEVRPHLDAVRSVRDALTTLLADSAQAGIDSTTENRR